MIEKLTASHRRLSALALLLLLVLAMCGGVIKPAVDWANDRTAERATTLNSLARDRAALTQDAFIKDELVNANKSPRLTRLYDSQRPDQAVQQLESDLRELLKTPNNPTSMTAQPATVNGSLTQIRVKVILSMPMDQFTEVLGRLQSHGKLLKVETLVVQAPDYQPPETNPTLSIQAEIAGFMLTTPSRSAG